MFSSTGIIILIAFFAIMTLVALYEKSWPLALYFAGATILNIGTLTMK